MSKPLVYIAMNGFPSSIVKLLEEYFIVKYWPSNSVIPRKTLLENVKGAFGIICSHSVPIDGEVVAAAGPLLKVVSTYSVGHDHISVDELKSKGIRIGFTPGVLTEATAELAVSLLLSTSRHITVGHNLVRNCQWTTDSWTPSFLCGQGLENATVGILGCGRIGLSIGRKLKPFNLRKLLYYSRSEKPEANALGGEIKSVDEIVKESDFIVVSLNLNEETHHIINKERINLMKPNAIIVNIGRGKLIDQAALTEALLNKKIGGAGLDVTDPEPIDYNDPLLKMDNVVITPHIGSATFGARTAMGDIAARNIIAVFEEKEMPAEIK